MLQFVFCAPQVHNVHGTPTRSKITIDVRYEIICDDDFAGFGDTTNCTPNSIAKNQKDPTVTTGNTTTLQTTPTTQLPTTTAATNNTSTTMASTTAGPFRCPAVGVFADPTDCHSYYRCDNISNPQRGTCLFYTRFDPNISGCSIFLC